LFATEQNGGKDACSNAEDPVQNNGSENDVEYHQAPVCTSPRKTSERKRKNIADDVPLPKKEDFSAIRQRPSNAIEEIL